MRSFVAALALLFVAPALAQSPGIPNLSVVNNDDLIQVVPRGVPTSPSRFATPPVIFTNRTVTNPNLVGGSFSGNWGGNLNLNNGLSVTGTSTLSGGGTATGLDVSLTTSATVTAAGSSQGTATALGSQNNIITTCPASAGVGLTDVTGRLVLIANRSGATCLIYPPSGAQIESYGTNAAVAVGDKWQQTFACTSATQCRVY